MLVALGLLYALSGLIIGSFLNVVILRWGSGKGVGGRSACLACGKEVAWYDLLPLVSYAVLRGRCRACGTRLSIQYPIVEGLTALLFVAVGLSGASLLAIVLGLCIISILIVIAVYDLRHTIIPDALALAFAAAAFFIAVHSAPTYAAIFMIFFAGLLTAAPLFLLWLVSRGTWMGLGDAKLAIGMGFALGIPFGLYALMAAFILGAAFSLPLLLFSSPLYRRVRAAVIPSAAYAGHHRAFTMKSEVPFGPFLIASFLAFWLAGLYGIPIPFVWQ